MSTDNWLYLRKSKKEYLLEQLVGDGIRVWGDTYDNLEAAVIAAGEIMASQDIEYGLRLGRLKNKTRKAGL